MENLKTKYSSDEILKTAKKVLEIESKEVINLSKKLDKKFIDAVRTIFACKGRVVVTGIGKSGHIGNKIAATLASTGTSSFFLHPAEAQHGDLGMVRGEDIVVGISYSGETEELCKLAPLFKRLGSKLISLTGNPNSSLATLSDIHLNASVTTEACSLNLAPTASTTAALALGDALAVVLLEMRGFKADDFARTHPAGALGRKLLIHVSEVMRTGKELPVVISGSSLTEALIEMSAKRMGMTCIVDRNNHVIGIITDGDLRRLISKGMNIQTSNVNQVMTTGAQVISANALASQAAHLMEKNRINHLLVVEEKKLIGAVGIHDLLEAKII
ncbi:MAG: arabinose-5-phosphate isomerase [Betaproteobacteria bacterium TMED156]|nr:MAG: arabinose-5-phosphate isomerase [Betaproteobacteria bacterium TMED156]|tara:strand:+ start:186 stop:1175 length:990 start_codon:yes stop_codon:yes gene_type:complete